MSSDETLVEFSAGKSIEVPVGSIEKELSRLWARVSDACVEGGKRRAITRACLWNLLIRTDGKPETLARAKRLVDEISVHVPARVLVLDAPQPLDGAAPAATEIRATVEANWHSASGGAAQIGSDEVTLYAAAGRAGDLAPIVRSLTVPDVPVAALWLGDAPARLDALDHELRAAADRLIFDGSSGGHLVPSSGHSPSVSVSAQGPDGCARCATSLTWLASAGARVLLAGLFDAPDAVPDLHALDEVTLVVRPDSVSAGHLYCGWLASRLGWRDGKKDGVDGRVTFTRRDGGSVAVQVSGDGSAPAPLGGVVLGGPSGRYDLSFVDGAVILETPSLARKEPFSPLSEVDLWIAALGTQGRDPLYLEALRHAAVFHAA